MGHYRIIKAPWGNWNVWRASEAPETVADTLMAACVTEAEAKVYVEALYAEDAQACGLVGPVQFYFDDGPAYDGFAHGSRWNGFDNVSVTPAVRDRIVADLWAMGGDGGGEELALKAPDEVTGLIDLSGGYATQLVRAPLDGISAVHTENLSRDSSLEDLKDAIQRLLEAAQDHRMAEDRGSPLVLDCEVYLDDVALDLVPSTLTDGSTVYSVRVRA